MNETISNVPATDNKTISVAYETKEAPKKAPSQVQKKINHHGSHLKDGAGSSQKKHHHHRTYKQHTQGKASPHEYEKDDCTTKSSPSVLMKSAIQEPSWMQTTMIKTASNVTYMDNKSIAEGYETKEAPNIAQSQVQKKIHHHDTRLKDGAGSRQKEIHQSSPSVITKSAIHEPSLMRIHDRVMEKEVKSKSNAYPILYPDNIPHNRNVQKKAKVVMRSTRSNTDDRDVKMKAKIAGSQMHSDRGHHAHIESADAKSKFDKREAKLGAKSGVTQPDQGHTKNVPNSSNDNDNNANVKSSAGNATKTSDEGIKRKIRETRDFHGTILEKNCKDLDQSNAITPEGANLARQAGLETCPDEDGSQLGSTNTKESRSSFASKSTWTKISGNSIFTKKSRKDSSVHLAVAKEVDPSVDDGPIYEASYYEPNETPPRYKTRKCQIYTAIILFLIAVLITLAVVFSIKKRKERSTVIYIPKNRTQSRESFIANTLLKGGVNFEKLDKDDPRQLAYEWILQHDTKKAHLNNPNFLMQRYALALLAFQLDFSGWTYCGAHSNATVKCSVETDDYVMKEYSRWLTDTDECEWYGVSCFDNGLVRELILPENQLIGEIPSEIGILQNMEVLSLYRNCIYGTIPTEIGSLTNLKHLDLDDNGLAGTVPNELYSLPLTYLSLARQGRNERYCVTSEGEVVNLAIDSNGEKHLGLVGKLFPGITSLKSLEKLFLNWNEFSGVITADVKNLQHLEVLSVSDNRFGGTLPKELFKLPHLSEIGIAWTNISGTIPQNIGQAKTLRIIDFNDAELSGTLPASLYELTNLESLVLHWNNFEGHIKPNIGKLKSLRHLSLWSNGFTGTIPPELGRCEELESIYIEHNKFSGTVPDEVCALREKHLYDPVHEFLRADCLHPSAANASFIQCKDCCDYCCDSTTHRCLNMQYDLYGLNDTLYL